MKPRANLGNRTRQPKGCANRIAKPARLGRTSQNHLMMIVLNKTGATTVAQPKTTGIQQCNNAKTAPFQRFLDTVTAIQNLLPAAFGVSTREPAALFFAPGDTPLRGVFVVCATLERLCDCVLACRVVSRGRAPLYAIVAMSVVSVVAVAVAVAAVPWTSWPWLWRHVSHVVAVASVASWTWPRHGRDRVVFVSLCVVATRRWMLVFPMVLMASHYPDLRNINVARIVIAIKQTTTERNGDEREATTTKPTAARTVTRKPPNRRGMDD